MWSFVRRSIANRVIRSAAPRPPWRTRLREWAWGQSSPAAKATFLATRERQLQREREAIRFGRDPFAGLFAPEVALAAAQNQSTLRVSTPWPALTTLGHHRYPGLRALPKITPFNLRRFSEAPPARRAISKVRDMVTQCRWQVKPKPHVLRKLQGGTSRLSWAVKLPDEMQRRIDAVEYCINNPNDDGDNDTWLTLLSSLIEDALCGFGAMEIQPTGHPDRPLALWTVDGSSIRINVNWVRDDYDDVERSYRYSQGLGSGSVPTQDLIRLKDREFCYVRLNPRTSTPFAFGPMEAAFAFVNAWLGAHDAREREESNEVAKFLISLGIRATPEETDRFRLYWQNWIEGGGQIPILGGMEDPRILQLRQSAGVDLAWPEWVTSIIAYSFGLTRQSFGIVQDVNRSTSETQATDEFISAALPVAMAIEDAFTRSVFEKALGWEDLELKCVVRQADAEKEAAIIEGLVDRDIITLDEGRDRLDYPAHPNGKGNLTLSEYKGQVESNLLMGAPGAESPTDRLARERTPQADGSERPTNGEDAALKAVRERVRTWLPQYGDDDMLTVPVDDPLLAHALQAELDRVR